MVAILLLFTQDFAFTAESVRKWFRCGQIPFAKRILNGFSNVTVNGANS